jgi:hypothetical protein
MERLINNMLITVLSHSIAPRAGRSIAAAIPNLVPTFIASPVAVLMLTELAVFVVSPDIVLVLSDPAVAVVYEFDPVAVTVAPDHEVSPVTVPSLLTGPSYAPVFTLPCPPN